MANKRYSKDTLSAKVAQELAHVIAFGPVVFQITRVMLNEGIFEYLREHPDGSAVEDIAGAKGLSPYAVKVLMESSLTLGTVLYSDGKYTLSKVGWFFLTDPMLKVNIDFNHDINYMGMFHLDKALREGRPAGLPELGPWPTIYEGLSSLDERQKESWFGFDHFYSDNSFDQALPPVFAGKPRKLMDIGGNTGKWAMKCVGYDSEVEVTVVDLPQQIAMMEEQTADVPGHERICGFGTNLLDPSAELPKGYDVIWMSQFLDCFSEEQVVSILERAARALNPDGRIFIMETLWDRQKYHAASFDLAQTSVYFTAMANGNSKMFSTADLWSYIGQGGLEVEKVTDGLGYAHSLIECRLAM
ncbi:MAG: methyltransferase domain-containing protein [Bacteroidales bacterium]|nr:methyltransferase domain-containing protein [Bacteroidales bacterium]